MSPEFHNALATLTIAYQYLNVVQNELDETIADGNVHFMFWNDREPDWNEYEQKTSHSDFRIMIPVLFCLYQGIELTMKGLLTLNKIDYNRDKKGHKFTELYEQIKKCADIPSEIKESLSYFIDPKFANLNTFLKANGKNLDNLSEILRYAVTKKSEKVLSYVDLKYQEQEALPYLREMLENLGKLKRGVRAYYKKFEVQETS